MSDRYGLTPQRRLRNRLLLIALALFIAAVMILWAVWAGLSGTAPAIDATDSWNKVIDASHVTVSITVDGAVGTEVSCALQAQDENVDTVGYLVVHLGKLTSSSMNVTKTLRTFQPAVGGSLDQCWVG